jgi:RNA 2',3'-cyclic 3'-phosphodiesterase
MLHKRKLVPKRAGFFVGLFIALFTNAPFMKRLFIAIPLTVGPGLKQLLQNLQSGLNYERIKWVNPAQIHLTLKFLGETPEAAIPLIKKAMDETVLDFSPFDLVFDKTGLFGSRYAPRVIWIGQQQPNLAVMKLGNTMLDAMHKLGFERDSQNFVPHLTLGRIQSLIDKNAFHRLMDRLEPQTYLNNPVTEVHLYESILRPQGPIHTSLHTSFLRG